MVVEKYLDFVGDLWGSVAFLRVWCVGESVFGLLLWCGWRMRKVGGGILRGCRDRIVQGWRG